MIDSFPHYFRILHFKVLEKIHTKLSYLKAYYWGVKLMKGGTFVGLPKFRRPPGSTITIGRNFRMLSSFSSNLHGLNRRCMLNCLTRSAKIYIGDDVGLSGVIVCSAVSINIGSRVMIGANTTLSDTDSHPINYKSRQPKYFDIDAVNSQLQVGTKKIIIEDDVFIGMHCLILKGAHIGRGSVIAAGSIVTGKIPPNVIAAGSPAKVIKSIKL
jgi:acetyltransferase-like isoleucine patch superfamily enzyme